MDKIINNKKEKIAINTEKIQLDQFLKWAGIVGTGGQVKSLIEQNMIKVNGHLETAKRKQLYPGDIIEIDRVGIWEVDLQEED